LEIRKTVVPLRRFKKQGSRMRRTLLKESKKKVKNILKKVWRNENVLYLCAALRNKGSTNDFEDFKPNKKKLKKL
jgi:hypothetical protein